MNTYWPGQAVLVHGEFYDRDANLIDPTTVTVKYKEPNTDDAVVVTPVNVSTGIYEYVIDTYGGTPGEWWYRFEAHGTTRGADEKPFRLLKSKVA